MKSKCLPVVWVVFLSLNIGQAQPDSVVQKRPNRFYISMPLHGGFTSYQLDPVSSTVSFPYGYVNSATNYTYTGKLNTGGYKATSPFYGIAVEGGFNRSFALNIQGSQISTISPIAKSILFNITLLYNINLNHKLTLQPAMGFGLVDTNINYPQSIDNLNKDILILGEEYPYSYYQYSRYGSRYIYSNQTNVSLKDRKEGYLARLTVRYRPAMLLTIGASLTAFFRVTDKTYLNIANKSTSNDITLPDSRVTFQSSSFGNDLFQLNALTFSVFVALYVSRE
jgi:hypothetical protein